MAFKKAKLLTHNDIELNCLIISRKPIITGGEEVLCYSQNRLVKGYVQDDDDDFVAELEIIVGFIVAPELSEELYEVSNPFF